MIILYAGSTSQTIDVFIPDSSSTTGAGLSGLVYNSSGLKAYYRKGATGTATAITLATQTVGGAYSSGGFVEIDATNMKGVYRLDVPNAMIDTSGLVTLYLYGATNMAPVIARVDCRAVPADVKLFGGTAGTFASGRPEVNTTHAAGNAWGSGAITAASIAASALNGKGDWNIGKTGYSLTATTGLGNQTANITGNLSGSVGSVTGAVGSVTAAVTVGTNNDKTGYSLTPTTGLGNQTANITGNLSGSVGSVTGAVGSVTAGVTVSTNNDKTGYSLTAVTGLGNQTANITGSLSGSVGSVTGNVGGNVVGSVGSVTGAVGSVTSSVTVGTNNDKTGYSLTATTGLGNQTANITGSLSGSVGSVTGNVGGNVVGSVGSVAGNVDGNVTGSVGSLATQAKADVNAEVLDVLATDTFTEPTGVVAATSSLKDKINWLFTLMRNKRTQTSDTETLYRDDGSTTTATSTKSDDGTTYTRGEWT